MSELVSIIITTYNRSDLIKETVDSCLRQSYNNYEVIVVDDGSTDDTKEVLAGYINSGKIVYHYKENAERAAARNTGAHLAKGMYIKFLDSDDLIDHAYLQTCVDYFNNNPTCEIVYTNCRISYKNGQVISPVKKGVGPHFYEKLWEYNDVSLSAVMMKKASFERSGGFDETRALSGAEDWEYWVRLSKQGYVFGFIKAFLTTIKMHDDNSTMNDIGKIISSVEEALRRLDQKFDDINENLEVKMQARLLYLQAIYSYVDKKRTHSLQLLFKAVAKNKYLLLSGDFYLLLAKNMVPYHIINYIKNQRNKAV